MDSGGGTLAVEQDLWERGFQLAYFLFPERGTALRILTGALNKLRVQRGRETRRSYWRDKHLKRGITRITRDESDALQWLIFSESDEVEKQQEEDHPALAAEMMVRYIKNLVRMTTAMSSFYVNIGLHRLLYNYSTAETQQVYESVTERFLGADEYRRAKSALMKKLLKRFGMLKTCRTQHGELRFETFEINDQQEVWERLVDTCLKAFTPWSTLQSCPVPAHYDASRDKLPTRLSGSGSERVDFNQVEINRCHAFIDPVCAGRLMEALLLQPPMEKLALPRFYMENERIKNDPTHLDSGNTSGLTPGERENISQQLSAQASRRKQADPQLIIVVVDGEERAQLHLKTASSQTITLEEGDELIEIRTRFAGEDLPLAIYPLAYTESRGLAAARETLWRGPSGNLDLTIVLAAVLGEEPVQATATIRFKPKIFPLASRAFWPDRRKWIPALAGLALVIAAVVTARFALVREHGLPSVRQAVSQSTPTLNVTPNPTPSATPLPQIAAAHVVYTLVPDELATRGSAGGETVIAVPKGQAIIDLDLPVRSEYAQKKLRASLKLFFKPGEILSENNLRPKPSKNGLVVTFTVPSDKLAAELEYAVELQIGKPGQKPETVESYGFRIKRSRIKQSQ